MTIFRCKRVLPLLTLLLCSCSLIDEFRISELERTCNKHAKISVRDNEAWREYLSLSLANARGRAAQFGEAVEVKTTDGAEVFDHRYGPQMKRDREVPPNQVSRNDIHILKSERVVATYEDYVLRIDGLETDDFVTCREQLERQLMVEVKKNAPQSQEVR